jgi:pyruvate dehydrogenase E2 component (dihydrolipoamide acetyltransferase)
MAVEFQMPKLGLTMEEGTILDWLVTDGAEVEQGTAVLTIETDKVASDVEASRSGVLHITANAGDTFACGARIGWFLEPGEAPPVDDEQPTGRAPVSHAPAIGPAAAPPRRGAGNDGARLFASPNARRVAVGRGVDLSRLVGSGPGGRIVSEDVLAARAEGVNSAATFAARRTAARLGVDLRDVRAGGRDPRIDRADVERHVREQMALARPTAPPPEGPLLQTPSSNIALVGMRGTIAARMHASLQEMAQLTLTMDVAMDAVIRHRSGADARARAGYTDYVLAAVARALADHPVVNSQIAGGQVALLPEINVGLAVALDGGLVVPVVRQADTLSLEALSAETTRLASAARAGELSRAEIEGGTFSVTALGMYGVDAFTPVINPPNTAILGVGRLRDGVRWDDDVPVRTTLLTLSLTWDHRAFDGAPAAEFTADVRDRLEGWGHQQ